jgi:hypothetical protein
MSVTRLVLDGRRRLPGLRAGSMLDAMFTFSDAEAAAIRQAYEQSGELAAAV